MHSIYKFIVAIPLKSSSFLFCAETTGPLKSLSHTEVLPKSSKYDQNISIKHMKINLLVPQECTKENQLYSKILKLIFTACSVLFKRYKQGAYNFRPLCQSEP